MKNKEAQDMADHRLARRQVLTGVGALGMAGMLAGLHFPTMARAAAGDERADSGDDHADAGDDHDHSRAQPVVTTYFGILNAGMKSGDFSLLASVYAPDATLTQSKPAGVTSVFAGLAAITGFYQTFQTKVAGYQWTQETMRSLARSVVLSYEHAGSPPLTVPGRCAHLFVVREGLIQSLDWVTFFPGQK